MRCKISAGDWEMVHELRDSRIDVQCDRQVEEVRVTGANSVVVVSSE
jgi:uncharacterized protein YajQ (UPF0234 family)